MTEPVFVDTNLFLRYITQERQPAETEGSYPAIPAQRYIRA